MQPNAGIFRLKRPVINYVSGRSYLIQCVKNASKGRARNDLKRLKNLFRIMPLQQSRNLPAV